MLTEFSQVENTNQLTTFCLAAFLGMILCLLYDCLRTLVVSLRFPKFLVHLSDIVYLTNCAVVCFCFLLVECQGEIRIYATAGFALGFYLFRRYLSPHVRKITQKFYILFIRIFTIIFRPLHRGFLICYNIIFLWVKKIKKTVLLFSKKKEKTLANDGEYDV